MLKNFVLETANAPGTTTTFNLGGAASGRLSYAGAGFTNGQVVFYVMDDGSQKEWGIGTFNTGSPNTLSRTTVISNTSGTTARLNFTGTTNVYCSLPAEKTLWVDNGGKVVIPGRTDAGSAAAGNIGELISSTVLVGSAVALTNNTAANITSISLTAGEWDVSGVAILNPGGSTVLTSVFGWINTVSATPPTPPGSGGYAAWAGSATASIIAQCVGPRQLSLSSTTTVYLGILANFTSTAPGGYGFIRARRIQA